ncbi:hypothetical protein ASA1KI_33510 [Opitutales bacterium ASA1]|uniref:plasmid pRiA4b ORF-3 family protein n=1 Tax=Congregicoccus parvus TaxID=3081749 RepID=UPI002B2EDD37|nr:hypothetical protein ASA1KI_33510 [Opitutales bacterium ASA1]
MASLPRRFAALAAKTPRPRTSGAKSTALAGQAVELEIVLRYIKPRIWRRFVVPGRIKLHRLHGVIQIVMGWTNSHLHSFRSGACEYVQRDPDDAGWQDTFSDTIICDERKHTLSDLVGAKGDKFSYTYDFGDNWMHELKVRSIRPTAKPLPAAFCVAGARACPPEDCGSVPGYEELCAALPDPKHPDHEHWKNWIGDYDPEAFDCETVNQLLVGLKV